MSDVKVYSEGLFYLSACASSDLSPGQVEERVNSQRLCGTSSGWTMSDDEVFAGGQPHPSRCNTDNDRMHYLLEA